jgi:hypothetical protein
MMTFISEGFMDLDYKAFPVEWARGLDKLWLSEHPHPSRYSTKRV